MSSALRSHSPPWNALLALFPSDVGRAVETMVARLRPSFGGPEALSTHTGVPDGYDGITQRGAYERLLPAEWLLLEAAPEEFLRRVIAHEHAFLRRAYNENRAGRRCLALFDVGADQLGAPRIAHLAILVLLSQRALRVGATFEWGVLQDENTYWHPASTESDVLALVQSRCAGGVSSEHLQRWATKTPPPELRSELWLIGSPSRVVGEESAHVDRRQPPSDSDSDTDSDSDRGLERASVVTVEDVIEPNTPRRLRVTVLRALANERKDVILEVPPPSVSLRLLRSPFSSARKRAGRSQIVLEPKLILAPNGRRLYARTVDGAIVTVPLPLSPADTRGRPGIVEAPQGHTVIGVGRSVGITSPSQTSAPSPSSSIIISRNGLDLFLHVLSRRGSTILSSRPIRPRHSEDTPSVAGGSTQLQPVSVFDSSDLGHLVLIDESGNLVEIKDSAYSVVEPTSGMGSFSFALGLAWLSLADGHLDVRWADRDQEDKLRVHSASKMLLRIVQARAGSGPVTFDRLPVYSADAVCVGTEPNGSLYFAYATSPSTWAVFCSRLLVPNILNTETKNGPVSQNATPNIAPHVRFIVPEGTSIIGLTVRQNGVVLVAIDATRRHLSFISREHSETEWSHREAIPIVDARVLPSGRGIAFINEAHDAGIVWFDEHETTILEVRDAFE